MEIVGDQATLRGSDVLNVERPIHLQLVKDGKVAETEEVTNYEAYARQVDAFAAALEHGVPFPVPGEEGWKNQIILDAAYRSLKAGKTEPVQTIS